MKTRSIKKSEISESWYVIDAKGKRLGILSARIASILQGKEEVKSAEYHNPLIKVIVVNSKDVDIHPKKRKQKIYYRHSGYMGGLTEVPFKIMSKNHPSRIIEIAVKGMLPKTKMGDALFRNFYVYDNNEHKHSAQNPKVIEL